MARTSGSALTGCNAGASYLLVQEKVKMAVRDRRMPAMVAEHPPAGAARLDAAS